MTAIVAYECEICAVKNPIYAWTSYPNDRRITPGGKSLCLGCWTSEFDYPESWGPNAWENAPIPPTRYLAEENPEEVADRMDALAAALIEVTREYKDYRESIVFPQWEEPDDLSEMDAIITRATEALTAAGYSLDDEITEETVQ